MTAIFTPTSTPTATQTPTIPPTPTTHPNAISVHNASQMEELASYGRGEINGMSVSPDGRSLAVSTAIGLWIYSLPSGEILQYFEEIPQKGGLDVPNLLWSPDGTMLAVGRLNNGVWVWDTRSWELVAKRRGFIILDGQYTSDRPGIEWSPDGRYLAVGTGVNSIWVWDRILNEWEDWSRTTNRQIGMTWTENGQLLMIGEYSEGVYDVTTGEKVYPAFHMIDGCCGNVVWSPDNNFAFAGFDLGGSVYDIRTETPDYAFWAGIYPNFAWSPDGLYFATSAHNYYDDVLWVYDLRTRERMIDLKINTKADALAWTSDGRLLAVMDVDGEKLLWDVHQEEKIFSLEQHYNDPEFFVWEQPDSTILNFDACHCLRIIGQIDDTYLLSHKDWINFSPENSLFVTSETIWDINKTAPNAIVHTAKGSLGGKISPDGRFLASGGDDGEVIIRDTSNGYRIAVLSGEDHPDDAPIYTGSIRSVFWSADSQSLSVIRRNEPTKQYSIGDWTIISEVEDDGIDRDFLSPDGKSFAKMISGNKFQIWDIESEEPRLELDYSGIFEFAWSPDGRLIALGFANGDVFILEAETGDLLAELIGHTGGIRSIIWSSDGGKLYTHSGDGTYRVWGILD